MNREVTYVTMHQDLFLPGVGSLGRTLPNQSKTLRLKMFETPGGIEIQVNGNYAVIPYPNVVLYKFVPEEPNEPKISGPRKVA